MSLVYTTLLSLVPLLAVSFSVLKAFGAHNQMQPLLLESLEPLGEQGKEIAEQVLAFVDNIRVGVLGSFGIGMLFVTVVSLLSKIEAAFNSIWHVARPRGLARRFSDYLSVILVGPVLAFAGLGFAASALDSEVVRWFASIEPFGIVLGQITRLGPSLAVCGGFAFVYGFLPNTRVRVEAALVGGLLAGLLWFTSGKIFADFVAGSSNYSAIYSGFASAMLFLIWLYVSWLIVLVGAQVAYFWQNPVLVKPGRDCEILAARGWEELALEFMTLVGRAHYLRQEPLWTLEGFQARHATLPPGTVVQLVKALSDHGLILASDAEPPAYLPARDTENISLNDVLAAARGGGGRVDTDLPEVEAVVKRLDEVIESAVAGRTLKELIVARGT
jgi:membrane protein